MKTKENIEVLNIQTENDPVSTGQFSNEEYTDAMEKLERKIQKVNRKPEYHEFNCIKLSDGNAETLKLNETEEEENGEGGKGKKRGLNSFLNDDEETRAKKLKAIEKFYSSAGEAESVKTILRGIFTELFAEVDIDEIPEDEMQNAAESFLTKRPWDVEKHPDYRRQLLYVMKYNLIPNMLNKYFGRKIKGMSDEEIQMRNFTGAGLRDRPGERNSFRRERVQDFDINEDGGTLLINSEENEGIIRMNKSAYETQKEVFEKERMGRAMSRKLREAERAMEICNDKEVKELWKVLKSLNNLSKIDVRLAEKMKKTQDETRAIKRRLTRYLRKEVKFDTKEFLKEIYEEKIAFKSR